MGLFSLQLRQYMPSLSAYDKPVNYLEHHVRIGDLRDSGEVEDNRQKEHKACDCEIYPLDVLQ